MKTKSEQGITLIALLVMIILLVILAAITIRGVTGNEGILNVAEIAAEDYKIKAKQESLEEAIRAEMIAKATQGKTATLGQVAEKLRGQEGIKDVKIDGAEDATERIHICRNKRPETYMKYTMTE